MKAGCEKGRANAVVMLLVFRRVRMPDVFISAFVTSNAVLMRGQSARMHLNFMVYAS